MPYPYDPYQAGLPPVYGLAPATLGAAMQWPAQAAAQPSQAGAAAAAAERAKTMDAKAAAEKAAADAKMAADKRKATMKTAAKTAAMAAIPVVGGVTSILGVTANDKLQKVTRNRIDQLEGKKKRGELGLTATDRRGLQGKLVNPVQAAAAAGRTRAEQLAAANQGSSAADYAELRDAQARQVAQAQQQAGLAIAQANERKKNAQLARLDQAYQDQAAMRADDYSTVLAGLTQTAGAAGMALGAPVGTYGLSGAFGAPRGGAAGGALDPQLLAGLGELAPEERSQLLANVRASLGGQ